MHDMTDKAAARLKSDGWKMVETTGFIQLVGPLWQRPAGEAYEYGLLTEDKHHNRRGLVQGGVLMTFADRTCGMIARHVTGKQTMATAPDLAAPCGARHAQPRLCLDRSHRRQARHRHGQWRVQDFEE